MNTLSSLPPPAFGAAVTLRGPDPGHAALPPAAEGGPLHVGSDARPRPIDEIERDFLAALCENPAA